MIKRVSVFPRIVVLSITVILVLCSPSLLAESAHSPLRVSGSSTLQPLLDRVAGILENSSFGLVIIEGGGTTMGIQDVIDGVSDVAAISRALHADEKMILSNTLIGFDAIAIVVNERNPLSEIGRADLVDVYSGSIDNWRLLADWSCPVVLVTKEEGRGTLAVFEAYSGLYSNKGKDVSASMMISPKAIEAGSDLEVVTLVGGIPGAIGYVSYAVASVMRDKGMPIKILSLDGITPSAETIADASYSILRELNLAYIEMDARIAALVDYLLSSEGRALIAEQGFLAPSEVDER